MSEKLTRASLISADIDKVALSKKTMYVVGEDGKSAVEVPIPKSIKAAGIIPEGYSVGECSYSFVFFFFSSCSQIAIAAL
jgi:hypothetical protein